MPSQGYKVTLISKILDIFFIDLFGFLRALSLMPLIFFGVLMYLGRPVRGKSATSFVVWNFLMMFQTIELGMSKILEISVALYPWEGIFKIVFRKSIETIFKQKLYRTKI